MRNGLDELYEMGQQEGLERGIEQGREQGREQGIKCFIEDKIEDGVSIALIKERLMKRFELSEEEADRYMNKYCEPEPA